MNNLILSAIKSVVLSVLDERGLSQESISALIDKRLVEAFTGLASQPAVPDTCDERFPAVSDANDDTNDDDADDDDADEVDDDTNDDADDDADDDGQGTVRVIGPPPKRVYTKNQLSEEEKAEKRRAYSRAYQAKRREEKKQSALKAAPVAESVERYQPPPKRYFESDFAPVAEVDEVAFDL